MKRQSLKQSGPKLVRCAIYTRKSTDHNLDLEFNSLDAQREASEAYIKSQAQEGWRLIPDRFDDGAFSGASLERPALQALMELVRSKQVDVIVVYKVDRLTRSLADFAKLVELFDEHEVSFVSVTQSFNTTSSMGRLTLNVLLSFAQFEREVIGERVRDKIAASKKKGLWVGGPVPLGYRTQEKKLVIVPEEAATVQLIFVLYLQMGSIRLLAQELRRRQITTKPQRLASGRVRGGGPFAVGPLRYLLKNRFYLGEVLYRGEIYPGEQQPILDKALYDAVQQKLADQAVARKVLSRSSPAILAGKLFDDRGNRMSPSHCNKRGVRYRYYTSRALLQGVTEAAGRIGRVSGPDIEAIVLKGLREHLAKSRNRANQNNRAANRPSQTTERRGQATALSEGVGAKGRDVGQNGTLVELHGQGAGMHSEAVNRHGFEGRDSQASGRRSGSGDLRGDDWQRQITDRYGEVDIRHGQADDRRLIDDHIEKIIVRPETIEVVLKAREDGRRQGVRGGSAIRGSGHVGGASEQPQLKRQGPGSPVEEDRSEDRDDESPIVLMLPWSASNHKPEKGILREPMSLAESGATMAPMSEWTRVPTSARRQIRVQASKPEQMTPPARDALLLAIAKARRWIDDLASGRAASFAEIASRENKVERHIRFLAPLAFLSPRVVSAITSGDASADLTISALAKAPAWSWAEQEVQFGTAGDSLSG